MKRLVVITSYPPRSTTHHKSVIGGASYTKNTLLALVREITKRGETPQITVLAQKIEGETESYQEDTITVKRVWERNSFSTFTRLLNEINKNHKHTKEILIELELNIFGKSGIFLIMLLPFMLSLKLKGKKVVLVIHEIIYDMEKFGTHINLKKGLKTSFYNTSLANFYKSAVSLSNKVIVFEESLKSALSEMTRKGFKIQAIPIAVEHFANKISREDARKKLGVNKEEFIVMTFGFLAWYKGTDWLAKVWDKNSENDNLKLIIAGGANPNRVDLAYYQKYLKDLEERAKEKNILLTGFIPEEDMQLYFAASDLVVFPYRTMMSSSAVLSMCFSFGKPFILSENMRKIFMGKDIKEELVSEALTEEDVLFPLDDSFYTKLKGISRDQVFIQKLENFSKKMREKRSWKLIAKTYYETLF